MGDWWMQDETYPVDPAVEAYDIWAYDGSFSGLILNSYQINALTGAFRSIGTSLNKTLTEVSRALGTLVTTTAVPSDRPKDKNGRPIPPLHNAGPRPNRAFSNRGRKLI